MKRILSILTIIYLMLSQCGCYDNRVITQKIMEPVANSIPISGKWQIVNIINSEKVTNNIRKKWLNKYAQFSKTYVSVGDYLFHSPSFKIRTISATKYLEINHKSIDRAVKIPNEDADVITITGKDKYLCEVLKLRNNEMLMEIYNYNLLLKKVSTKLDVGIYNKLAQTENNEEKSYKDNLKTGVMLGLRSLKSSLNPKDNIYNYRTLFIATNGKKLLPVEQTNNIFFPRKSGFWKLDIKRSTENGTIKDVIHSYNIFIGKNEENKKMKIMFLIKSLPTLTVGNIIDYVGNDYAAIETTNYNDNSSTTNYRIVPIDSLPNLKPVKMNDIMGREGVKDIDINARNLINVIKGMGYRIDDDKNIEDNFGLVRKNGHWNFQGRINYGNEYKTGYQDYRINLIPPSNLIFYDELSISWNNIKARIPEAVDAFTSPNKDIALVLSKNSKLLIYEIVGGYLSLQPIQTINLKSNEKIIMAEWATGNYVENWEKSFSGLK